MKWPGKTPSLAKSSRSASLGARSSKRMGRRSVCCRSGRSRPPPLTSSRRGPRRASSCSGDSSFVRAAASSIASGRPSRLWQISGHGRRVVIVDAKVGPKLASSIDEETNRVVLAHAIEVLGSRQRQGLDDELVLPPHPQHRAARHHEFQLWTRRPELGDERGRRRDLFEVVEDEQRLAAAEELADRRRLALPADRADTKGSQDGGGHQDRILDGGELDKKTPSGKLSANRRADSTASRLFPTPPGPVKRDDPGIAAGEKIDDGAELTLPADQRRSRCRNRSGPARRGAAWRPRTARSAASSGRCPPDCSSSARNGEGLVRRHRLLLKRSIAAPRPGPAQAPAP